MRLKANEKETQKATLDYLGAIGAVAVKFNNVGIMKSNGRFIPPRELGVSDILACYKGKFLAIEIKSEGKFPTDWQERFIERINQAGGIAFWADNINTVISKLRNIK